MLSAMSQALGCWGDKDMVPAFGIFTLGVGGSQVTGKGSGFDKCCDRWSPVSLDTDKMASL